MLLTNPQPLLSMDGASADSRVRIGWAYGVPPAGSAISARARHFIHRLDPKGFPVATGSDDKS